MTVTGDRKRRECVCARERAIYEVVCARVCVCVCVCLRERERERERERDRERERERIVTSKKCFLISLIVLSPF